MKKFLVLLMAIGLVAASCNNNKGKDPRDDRNSNNRERDDYRNDDRNRDRDEDNNRDRDRDDYSSSGWSNSDKKQWMKVCVDPLVESLGESKAENYCSCVLDKIQEKYSNFDKANTMGSEEEGVELGKACMSELFK